MKLIRNTGAERVIDLLRPQLTAGRQLDVVTPTISLFAFSEMQREVDALVGCRLLLPSTSAELALLGSDADRAARNRLQTRWLASRLSINPSSDGQALDSGKGPLSTRGLSRVDSLSLRSRLWLSGRIQSFAERLQSVWYRSVRRCSVRFAASR